MINKRGLSEVVTTVIMIALVMAAAAIIWGVVSSLIQEQTGNAEACFGNYDKVTLYGEGTCYIDSQNVTVYVMNKDVTPDKIIVSISTASESKSFEIPGTDPNVKVYTDTVYGKKLDNLSANSGRRYQITNLKSIPTLITVSPVIGGSQCGISDTIKTVGVCT